jgi:hypothetical protein
MFRQSNHPWFDYPVWDKAKCCLVWATNANRGSRTIAPHISNLCTWWRCAVNFKAPTAWNPKEKNPVPIEQEAGWALESVWTVLEKIKSLAPTGIRNLDRLARSLGAILTTVSQIQYGKECKFHNMHFSPISCYSSTLTPRHCPRHPILEHN